MPSWRAAEKWIPAFAGMTAYLLVAGVMVRLRVLSQGLRKSSNRPSATTPSFP
jgi:hypothetical protein